MLSAQRGRLGTARCSRIMLLSLGSQQGCGRWQLLGLGFSHNSLAQIYLCIFHPSASPPFRLRQARELGPLKVTRDRCVGFSSEKSLKAAPVALAFPHFMHSEENLRPRRPRSQVARTSRSPTRGLNPCPSGTESHSSLGKAVDSASPLFVPSEPSSRKILTVI